MIKSSELILNPDGSVFHLHLLPGQVADTIIMVGDPDRVDLLSRRFDRIDARIQNREFLTCTGYYKGMRLTVISTGIGTDNIDIVVNELDALVNIDLNLRKQKSDPMRLNFIRLGTSGALQADIPVGSFVLSEKAIGFDGLLGYYEGVEEISDSELRGAFKEATGWKAEFPEPYVVNANKKLFNLFADRDIIRGVTISTPGFYGPQGRTIRLPLADPDLNRKIVDFRYGNHKVVNFEMESSAIYGLAGLLGHRAITLCAIIANRATGEFMGDYSELMQRFITYSLNRLDEKRDQL